MPLKRFYYPHLSINSYLLYDERLNQGALIDPIRDIEPYIQFAQENGLVITDILETHVHADFISGAKELKARLGGKPKIHCSGLGGTEWTPRYADHIVQDREEFSIGSLRFQAWHTPGHTPEHLMWVVYDDSRAKQSPWIAFTGDLIFVGSLGRPDLLGEKAVLQQTKQLYDSIFRVVSELPDFVEIFPAHGAGSLCGQGISSQPSSTLGYERQYNPGFIEKGWMERMQRHLPAAPQYFKTVKKLNVEGPSLMPLTMPKAFSTLEEAIDCFLVDVRNPEEFARQHVRRSVNIPWGSFFSSWAGAVIPSNLSIALVLDEHSDLKAILSALRLIGYDRIIGYMDSHKLKTDGWESFPLISAEALSLKQREMKDSLYILDVRTDVEWAAGHIQGAHHIELNVLAKSLPEISKRTPIAVLCGKGNRASIAASLLKREGFENVSNVKGGMHAWNRAKLPSESQHKEII